MLSKQEKVKKNLFDLFNDNRNYEATRFPTGIVNMSVYGTIKFFADQHSRLLIVDH